MGADSPNERRMSYVAMHRKPSAVPNGWREWAVGLTTENMQRLYEESDWGWDPRAKRQELESSAAHYVFLCVAPSASREAGDDHGERNRGTEGNRGSGGVSENQGDAGPMSKRPRVKDEIDAIMGTASQAVSPVGFAHVRFHVESGRPALYIYEFQIEPFCQRQGAGGALMKALIDMARQSKMELIVLTVFTHNESARAFYRKTGFVVDDSSPPEDASATHEILSMDVSICTPEPISLQAS